MSLSIRLKEGLRHSRVRLAQGGAEFRQDIAKRTCAVTHSNASDTSAHEGRRARIFEVQCKAAHVCRLFSNASSTRAGVSGRNGTRTPIAFATAFEIAAPGDTTGGSASPITPRSS